MRSDLRTIKKDVGKVQRGLVKVQTDVAKVQTDMAKVQTDVRKVQTDVGKIQTDLGNVQTDMTDMRTEMRAGFAGLETRISVVYVFISFRDSGLTSTRSDYNSLARAHNATVNNARSLLQDLKTKTDVVPNGFPASPGDLSSIGCMRHFHRFERRITLTIFSCSTQFSTHCIRSTYHRKPG